MNIDLSPVMAFFNDFFNIVNSALSWVMDALLKLLWGVLYVVYDGLLTMIQGVVAAIDVSTLINHLTASWSGMPAFIVWGVNQAGIPSGLAIIGYALMIRMTLNLIPGAFTRI